MILESGNRLAAKYPDCFLHPEDYSSDVGDTNKEKEEEKRKKKKRKTKKKNRKKKKRKIAKAR